MNLLDQVVANNDQAAYLMLAGRNEEAHVLLLRCLEMVKSSIHQGIHLDLPTVAPTPTEEGTRTNIMVPTIRGLSRTDSFVYGRPLFYRHICRAYNFQAYSKAFASVMIASTIVFNLALLQHSIGNQTGSDVAFTKARQLYSMTIGLLSSQTLATSGYPPEVRVLASNNLCHLLFLQRSSQPSLREAQQLVSSIQSLMSQMRQSNGFDLSQLVLIQSEEDHLLGMPTLRLPTMTCRTSLGSSRVSSTTLTLPIVCPWSDPFRATSRKDLESSLLTQTHSQQEIELWLEQHEMRWRKALSLTFATMTSASEEALMRKILTQTKTIALVGASPKPERASNYVMQFLLSKGYNVVPVNPVLEGQQLLGQTVYADLKSIPEPIDMVDIFRNSDAVPPIVDEAIQVGAKAVWMQHGVIHDAAAKTANDAGLEVVMDRCPKEEIPRLGIDGPKSEL
eukprot:Nitzschia sp. Nitz4//scaffold101_size76361//20593//22168//NITZ4_005597-RA/size76361-processed-gene-0.31-mRNA-1//-1//CDS//3329532143//7413//frame0